MPDIKWTIKGREFVQCNCDYGCPCQFNSRPTHGDCHALLALQIDEVQHGDTSLDGLRAAAVVSWPGAIHEGHGEVLAIVDERASEAQREALLRIMTGQDTEPGATMFQVFSTTYETIHDPVFAPIDFSVDIDGRNASVAIPGIAEARGEPIVNPVTGDTHRARINLPHGFEYDICEIGRGWTKTKDPVALTINDRHAQFAHLHLTESGVVHASA